MSKYNFIKFKAALALLNDAVSTSETYEIAALKLAKKTDNEFYDFVFMNYAGDIENQITEGISEMMAIFDTVTDEEL